MDDFLKKYRMACEAEVSPYGFKRKKNVFIRVVNDVCQNFYVEKLGRYSYGRECRVGFSVQPLCSKFDREWILSGVGLYYLKKFELNDFRHMDGWCYKVDPVSISACVDEIVYYIKRYLLPFFESAASCKTALPDLIALEKLLYKNHTSILDLNNIEYVENSHMEFDIMDNVKYFMALKSEDYDFALRSRKALLKQNIRSYESMDKIGYLNEESRMERKEQIREIQDEIQKIEEKDWAYIQTMIENNEAYSREELKDII